MSPNGKEYQMKLSLLLAFVIQTVSVVSFASEQASDKFKESDFYWDSVTSPHKEVIIAGVNKVHRENARCKILDPSSAYVSSSRGSSNDPVFFVTCGKGASVFNAFFSKSDVTEDETLIAVAHINSNIAVDRCEAYAKSISTHPSTVEFSRILDLSVVEHPNGRSTVRSTFNARNGLNLELKYNIQCLMDAKGLFEPVVSEVN